MASADFSRQILFQPGFILCFHPSVRPPTVRHVTFIPYTRHIYTLVSVQFIGFCLVMQTYPLWMPNMVLVPRAGTLLITLPSDSTSRWTPLRLANGWQLPAPVADFHRQVTRHAWRT